MFNLRSYAKPVIGLSLALLFARCSHVVCEPTGKTNPLDMTFIGLSGLVMSTEKFSFISFENLITKGVFRAFQSQSEKTNRAEYTKGLIGTVGSVRYNSYYPTLLKTFYILKNNPRGIEKNSYSDAELRAFYISEIQRPSPGEPRLKDEWSLSPSLEFLAKTAYNKIATGYLSVVDDEIRYVKLHHEQLDIESTDIKDFKVEFTGNANASMVDIACKYVDLTERGSPSEFIEVYRQIAGKYVAYFLGISQPKDIKRALQQSDVVCPS